MNNKEIIDLINKQIDGIISDSELKKLTDILEKDSAVRKLRAEYLKIAERLNSVMPVDPPADLKANILSSIDINKYVAKERHSIVGLFRGLRSRMKIAYAYSFAAGALVGAAILLLFLQGPKNIAPLDTDDLAGTIISRGNSAKFKPVDIAEFSTSGASGTVTVRRADAVILIDANVRSSAEIRMVFIFDQASILYEGLDDCGGPGVGTLHKQGAVVLIHKGPKEYTLRFKEIDGRSETIGVEVYCDSLIFSEDIGIRR